MLEQQVIDKTFPTNCPKCDSSRLQRSPRKNWERALEAFVIIKAYRCKSCLKRFTRLSKPLKESSSAN